MIYFEAGVIAQSLKPYIAHWME